LRAGFKEPGAWASHGTTFKAILKHEIKEQAVVRPSVHKPKRVKA